VERKWGGCIVGALEITARSKSPRGLIWCACAASTAMTVIAVATEAQAQQTGASNVQLGTIDVTSPTGVATPASQVASSITVITAADLERDQRRTVPDALATVPGLNVVQTGGPGGVTYVYIRGADYDQVKVLIDGIDVSNPVDANLRQAFDFSQLLTGDIERIEILRGPQSGFYGSDAIGGVISITTKSGHGPPQVTATVEGGSFGTFNQKAGLSGSQDQLSYNFSVQHFQSASTPVTPLNTLLPGEQRVNDFYDNKTYSGKVVYNFSDNFSINATSRYTVTSYLLHGNGDDVPFPFTDAGASSQGVQQSFSRGEADWSLFDGKFKNYFGAAYSYTSSDFMSPQTPLGSTPPGYGPNSEFGERLKYDWRGVWTFLPNQALVMGAEDEHFTFSQINPTAVPGFAFPTTFAENRNDAAYLELQTNFSNRFFFVANGRIDDNKAFGEHETFRLAPAFIVPEIETKLKASYGTGFKAPSLGQLYLNFPAFNFFSNPNLKPETSSGWDVGFEQPLLNKAFLFGVTYYHNDFKDLISSFTNTVLSTWTNIGVATTEGTESFLQWNVLPSLSFRADVTTTRAIDDTTGLQLLERPKDKESFTVTWKPIDKLQLSGTVIHVGPWVDLNRVGTETNVPANPYTVVNLASNYTYNDQLTIFGRIDNLFNEHYEVPIGFLRPGFGIFGGVRVTELVPTK
jgi:vitamin B12 transporter